MGHARFLGDGGFWCWQTRRDPPPTCAARGATHTGRPGRDRSCRERELLGAGPNEIGGGAGRPRRVRCEAGLDGLADPVHHLLQRLPVYLASPAKSPDRGRIAPVRVPREDYRHLAPRVGFVKASSFQGNYATAEYSMGAGG
jgi:hypothetical protein